MELFLIRHAQAVDGSLYGDDGERPLSPAGRRAALDVGTALARHGVKLDAIVTSPLVRAVETAELVAVQIGFDGALDVSHELAPEGRPSAMLEHALKPHAGKSRVALVGHLPSMGHLLSALLERSGLSMSKGTVVRLTYNKGAPAQLVWILTPKRLDPVASLDAL